MSSFYILNFNFHVDPDNELKIEEAQGQNWDFEGTGRVNTSCGRDVVYILCQDERSSEPCRCGYYILAIQPPEGLPAVLAIYTLSCPCSTSVAPHTTYGLTPYHVTSNGICNCLKIGPPSTPVSFARLSCNLQAVNKIQGAFVRHKLRFKMLVRLNTSVVKKFPR